MIFSKKNKKISKNSYNYFWNVYITLEFIKSSKKK